jgi:hypothetical protein
MLIIRTENVHLRSGKSRAIRTTFKWVPLTIRRKTNCWDMKYLAYKYIGTFYIMVPYFA